MRGVSPLGLSHQKRRPPSHGFRFTTSAKRSRRNALLVDGGGADGGLPHEEVQRLRLAQHDDRLAAARASGLKKNK